MTFSYDKQSSRKNKDFFLSFCNNFSLSMCRNSANFYKYVSFNTCIKLAMESSVVCERI